MSIQSEKAIDVNEELNIRCIWNAAEHSAFTDLVRFNDRWLVCFREADNHACGRDGILRIIESRDGVEWQTTATFELDGLDLRDPHFSQTPDGRLMLVCAGRVFRDGQFQTLQSFCTFSIDGRQWSTLQETGPREHWLWRVVWADGIAYSWVREQNLPGITSPQPFRLLRSPNGITWEIIAEREGGNEASILVGSDGVMRVWLRGWNSQIGESRFPYIDWVWYQTGYFAGGPHWIELVDGRIVAGARLFRQPSIEHGHKDPFMLFYEYEKDTKALRPILELPSGGDCTYPGLVEYEGELWVSYYSGHEGKSAIYLARVPLAALEGDLLQKYPPYLATGEIQ
jgi:hypothetical protein